MQDWLAACIDIPLVMAPKKKGSKAKSADPAKFVDKERIKRAEAEIVSLQRLLEVRNHEVEGPKCILDQTVACATF